MGSAATGGDVTRHSRGASKRRCYRGLMPPWLLIPGAILLGYVIWRVGMATLRSLAGPAAGSLDPEMPPAQAEAVGDVDVSSVCGGSGAALKVPGLAELQIPRHCGEK